MSRLDDAGDERNATREPLPDPNLPDPPDPRKAMEIYAATNLPDPPPPMLSAEETPDVDDA